MRFSPVMVLCAKEGVDTLTEVRLIEEALEIEQIFLDLLIRNGKLVQKTPHSYRVGIGRWQR